MATTFLVAIEGLEERPEPRQGDISASGIYFETKVDVGGAGTIHWLHLVSADEARELHAMACVVRTAIMTGTDGDEIRGAAFEFMPAGDDTFVALSEFVRYCLALRSGSGDPYIAPRLDAEAVAPGAPQAPHPALVRKLSVRSMVLETSWAIAPGEAVRVDIVAPGMTRRIRLDGKATRVAPRKVKGAAPVYTIEVQVEEESERPLRRHSSMSFARVRPEEMAPPEPPAPVTPGAAGAESAPRMLDDLLSSLILPPLEDDRRKGVHHLSGQIARVRLPTLCSLFEVERLSGVLVVRRDIEEVHIYVDGGQIVDIEPLTEAEEGRARLRTVLAWDDGTFEFDIRQVNRRDRIGMPMTALLIDLAREGDEEAKGATPRT